MIRKPALLLLFAFLAGCGTEQERCISRNTHEYRVLSELLTETDANLARGYAWEEREVSRMELDYCPDYVRDKDGRVRVIQRSCWRDVIDTERYRVPIDPAAEQRRRDYLAEKLKTEATRAEAAVRQCKAAYPEEG